MSRTLIVPALRHALACKGNSIRALGQTLSDFFSGTSKSLTSSSAVADCYVMSIAKTKLKFNLNLSESDRLRFELKIYPWPHAWLAQTPRHRRGKILKDISLNTALAASWPCQAPFTRYYPQTCHNPS